MRIAIVDDDIQIYHSLCAYLAELSGEPAETAYFSNGEDFLRAWPAESFDAVILDIFMEGLTGVEVAEAIRRRDTGIRLVFSTSSNEFASESYAVNACYYLRKPLGREQVKAMLDRLDPAAVERLRTVRLPDGTDAVLRGILYADCASHLVTLHGGQGGDIVLRTRFSEIEKLLCAYPYFISPTKGVVVNLYEVIRQKRDVFEMSDGVCIPISRRRASDVLEAWSSFLFGRLRKGENA